MADPASDVSANPYAPPQAPLADADAAEPRGPLGRMSFEQVSKLRNHSHTIRALGALWALGAVLEVGLGVMFMTRSDPSPLAWIMFPVAALSGLSCYCAWWRPAWGRAVGIGMCVLSMFGALLGIIIGALGLIAFIGGGKLFGPDRMHHRDVEAEFKRQKADNKNRVSRIKANQKALKASGAAPRTRRR